MKVSYQSYTQFALKADVLARTLGLTALQAAELLAFMSGYERHATMQIGLPADGPPLTRREVIQRLQVAQPELTAQMASELVDQLHLTLD